MKYKKWQFRNADDKASSEQRIEHEMYLIVDNTKSRFLSKNDGNIVHHFFSSSEMNAQVIALNLI